MLYLDGSIDTPSGNHLVKIPKETSAKSKKEPEKFNPLESWIWDAACSIRGAKDAPNYNKGFSLPSIFTK